MSLYNFLELTSWMEKVEEIGNGEGEEGGGGECSGEGGGEGGGGEGGGGGGGGGEVDCRSWRLIGPVL